MKTCCDCKQDFALSCFYKAKGTRDGLVSRCKKCTVIRYRPGVLERAKRDRAYFQAIKLECGCADCGYRENAVALDFDHMPGTVKRYRICSMAGLRRELVDAEIAKCEVVCANCHRIRTHARGAAGYNEHGRRSRTPYNNNYSNL